MNTDLLTQLDPAPRAALTARESDRRDQLLTRLLDDTTPAPRRSKRRWAIGAATVLTVAVTAAVAGAVLVGPRVLDHVVPQQAASSPYLSTADLASWTSAPATMAPSAKLTDWCLDSIGNDTAATPTISNAAQRGSVASMIVTRGGYTSLCIAGESGGGFSELIAEPTDVFKPAQAGTVTIDSAGSHGDAATGFTYVEGRSGSDVAGVTVTDSGRTVRASVENGRWTAWWPTSDPHGTVTGTVTLRLTDGTTRVVSGADLQP